MNFKTTSAHAPAKRSNRPRCIGMLVLAVVGVAAMSIAGNPEVATSSTQSGVTPDHPAAEWPELPLDPAAALDPRRVALRDAGGELLAIYLTWYEASERNHADRASEQPPAPRLRWRPIWTSNGMEPLPQAVFTATPIITTLAPGDVDADGTVGQYDAALVLSEWGSANALGIRADLNASGTVGMDDLVKVVQHWGEPVSPESDRGLFEHSPDCCWPFMIRIPCQSPYCDDCCYEIPGGGGDDGTGTNPGGGHDGGGRGGGGDGTGIGNPGGGGGGGGGGEDPCDGFGDELYIAMPIVRQLQGDPSPIPIGWVNDDDDDFDGVRDDADGDLVGGLVENDLYPVTIPTSGVRSWSVAVANGCRVWRARPELQPPASGDPYTIGQRLFDGKTWQLVEAGEVITPDPIIDPEVRIEVTRPSVSIGDLGLSIRFIIDRAGGGTATCIKAATFTGLKLGVHDLRHWGPRWDPQTDQPSVENTDLRTSPEVEGGTEVQGAITDGASLCLIRLDGPALDLGLEVRLRHGTIPALLGGSVVPITGPIAEAILPRVPVTLSDPLALAVEADFSNRVAFFVPPESFPFWAEDTDEVTPIKIELTIASGGSATWLTSRTFWLRRPPVVLVHGIRSGPAVWSTTLWDEGSEGLVPAKMYRVDYSATNNKGYSENYRKVALKIEEALNEYRHGLASAVPRDPPPPGAYGALRYAATRADAVGHSQGGQLIRWYICNTAASGMTLTMDRPGWLEDIDLFRRDDNLGGRWPYLRDQNWGAGSVRRFISLNSPFKGSPIANATDRVVAPGDATRPRDINDDDRLGLTIILSKRGEIAEIDESLTGNESTCISDLRTDSPALWWLSVRPYPSGRKRVLWHPVWTFVWPSDPPYASRGGMLRTLGLSGGLDLTRDNSDWVVTIRSQQNLPETAPSAFIGRGTFFESIAHSDLFDGLFRVLPGPTSSSRVQERVTELLTLPVSDTLFDPNWSLGP